MNSSESIRSQVRRQSVRHSPWHLNSLPRPPILPPHPGHTQFRMPDITPALPTIVVLLINCICTSRKKQLSAFHIQACGNYHELTSTSDCHRSPIAECSMHFPFQNARGRRLFGFKRLVSITLRNGVLHRGIRGAYGNVPRAAVAFAVLPSPASSFRCEGGSRSPRL